MIIDYLTHTLRHSLFLIVSMELIFSFTYHMKYKMVMRNSRENSAESTASLLADPSSKKTAIAPLWINNAFVLLAFAMSLAGCVASPTLRGNLLLLPFILLLVDSELDTNEWMELVVNKCRLLIPPFVLVSVIKLVFEVAEMKAPINKQNMDWLYYLLTDLRVRRVREFLLFGAVTPSYYSAFCLSSGFYYMSDTFVAIFGLLCIVGLFSETRMGRLYAILGLVSSVIQYVYVRIQERESLKYI